MFVFEETARSFFKWSKLHHNSEYVVNYSTKIIQSFYLYAIHFFLPAKEVKYK